MSENGNNKTGLIVAIIILSIFIIGLIAFLIYKTSGEGDYKELYKANELKVKESQDIIDSLDLEYSNLYLEVKKWRELSEANLLLADLEALNRDTIKKDYEEINDYFSNVSIRELDSIIAEIKRSDTTGL